MNYQADITYSTPTYNMEVYVPSAVIGMEFNVRKLMCQRGKMEVLNVPDPEFFKFLVDFVDVGKEPKVFLGLSYDYGSAAYHWFNIPNSRMIDNCSYWGTNQPYDLSSIEPLTSIKSTNAYAGKIHTEPRYASLRSACSKFQRKNVNTHFSCDIIGRLLIVNLINKLIKDELNVIYYKPRNCYETDDIYGCSII
ncbi:hypothetical protein SNEBB_002103 [Seison nebaliae]|nr:hypothetical protein SNEBB_002103 [Seison nebaliae]